MIFQTIEQFRDAARIHKQFSLEDLALEIEYVEETELLPLLGDAALTELRAAAQVATPTTPWTVLLPLARKAVANLAMARDIVTRQTNHSPTGVQIVTSGDHKTAFQWQIRERREHLQATGYAMLDRLLLALEALDPQLTSWTDAREYAATRGGLLNTLSEFQAHRFLQDSPLAFRSFAPCIRRVEQERIRPLLGDALFQEIVTASKARTLSAAQKDLLTHFIHPAIVHQATAEAIADRIASVYVDGVRAVAYTVATSEGGKQEESTPYIASFLDAVRKTASEASNALRRRLFEKVADFPSFASSATYINAQAPPDKNPNTNKVFRA